MERQREVRLEVATGRRTRLVLPLALSEEVTEATQKVLETAAARRRLASEEVFHAHVLLMAARVPYEVAHLTSVVVLLALVVI